MQKPTIVSHIVDISHAEPQVFNCIFTPQGEEGCIIQSVVPGVITSGG